MYNIVEITKLTFVCNLLHFYNKLWFKNGICFVTKSNIDDPEIRTLHLVGCTHSHHVNALHLTDIPQLNVYTYLLK